MAQSLGPVFSLRGHCPPHETSDGLDYLPDSQLPFLTEGGIGYLLEIFSPALRTRLLMGTTTTVYIAEIVREDADIYYAFNSAQERALFIEIKELKDVGPKVAATVVGLMGIQGVLSLVMGKEWAGPKIPGLGAKTLDTLKFGLTKKKEKFIKLLSGPGLTPSLELVAENSPAQGATLSKTLRMGLEGLGMPSTVSLSLYAECAESDPAFSEMDDAAKLKVMLRRWGQVRMGGVVI